MSPRRNKALVRAYWKSYETGDLDAVMAFVHPDHVFHPEGGARAVGYRRRRQGDAAFLRTFSRVRVAVEDLIAEGDRVASRVVMTATHARAAYGLRATRRRIRIPFLDIARVRGGKIVEEWTEYDWESLRRRMGTR